MLLYIASEASLGKSDVQCLTLHFNQKPFSQVLRRLADIITDDQIFGNLTKEKAKAAPICFGISIVFLFCSVLFVFLFILLCKKEQMVPRRAAYI